MLKDVSYWSRDYASFICLGEVLQVTLRMQTHFRMVFPLLTGLYNYCWGFDLAKSVSMYNFRLRRFLLWLRECSWPEHGVSFAWARLSVRKHRAVVSVQELRNDRSNNLAEHFCLTILVKNHIEGRLQIVMQIRLHRYMLFKGLNDVFVTKFDLRVQGPHADRHLQSFVQWLANLLVG